MLGTEDEEREGKGSNGRERGKEERPCVVVEQPHVDSVGADEVGVETDLQARPDDGVKRVVDGVHNGHQTQSEDRHHDQTEVSGRRVDIAVGKVPAWHSRVADGAVRVADKDGSCVEGEWSGEEGEENHQNAVERVSEQDPADKRHHKRRSQRVGDVESQGEVRWLGGLGGLVAERSDVGMDSGEKRVAHDAADGRLDDPRVGEDGREEREGEAGGEPEDGGSPGKGGGGVGNVTHCVSKPGKRVVEHSHANRAEYSEGEGEEEHRDGPCVGGWTFCA